MTYRSVKRLLTISIILFTATFCYVTVFWIFNIKKYSLADNRGEDIKNKYWLIQSIDTVKYSRDLAREKERDTAFDIVIAQQVRNIAKTGATHLALGTPYDVEFLPFLKRWVAAAREYGLKIWYRGNFSGWEEWFGYTPISRADHIKRTEEFIFLNSELFEDGDIFSPCTECENGGPGDPRTSGDIEDYRNFLINEYLTAKSAFSKLNKNVIVNYPMNGDVAELVMDKKTTKKLGGVVVVDHYVYSAKELAKDLKQLAKDSGGQVILGEFGYPIPDIHGARTAREQAEWLNELFNELIQIKDLVGVNYWTSTGGSTEIWSASTGYKYPAVEVINNYFSPQSVWGSIRDELGRPIAEAWIAIDNQVIKANADGIFSALSPVWEDNTGSVIAKGYMRQNIDMFASTNIIVMKRLDPGIIFRILVLVRSKLII